MGVTEAVPVADAEGVDQVRQIDETRNRLRGSEESNTFFGRDVFGYVGARLASGVIGWSEVGPLVPNDSLANKARNRRIEFVVRP